jgi:hypothetical protein
MFAPTHPIRFAFSSKASVTERTGPPSADTRAIRLFLAKERVSPMAELNAICFPSGDHSGPVSGPGCETIFLTESSARVRT